MPLAANQPLVCRVELCRHRNEVKRPHFEKNRAATENRIAGSRLELPVLPLPVLLVKENMRIWNVSSWGQSIPSQLASQKGLVAGLDQIAFPGPEALSWSTNPAPKPESCSDFYSKLGAA